jgi:hypothetical protein
MNKKAEFIVAIFKWVESEYAEASKCICHHHQKVRKLLTRVGVSNFVDFIWIQPDLLFAAFHHRGCEPLLQFEGTEKKK